MFIIAPDKIKNKYENKDFTFKHSDFYDAFC